MAIFQYDMMKNVYIERAYFSASQKMYLPSASICKRIGIFMLLFIFVYVLIPWKHEGKKIYNKWKSDRSSQSKYDNARRSYKDCEPRKKVAFLKTHKCASTSIQNILLRFGRKNNLNFVLPFKGNNVGTQVPFRRDMIKGTLWELAGLNYDMFLVHTRWNSQQISKILNDQGDVLYVSILRDPVDLFRSWWDYLRLDKRYNKTLEEYALSVKREEMLLKNGKIPFGFNQMLYDFGMDSRYMHDRAEVERKIQDIDETFDIVLLADKEFFDDSIILLKDALCWEYRDMINFQLNSKKVELKSNVSLIARKALNEWLWADSLLYTHFKKKFIREREAYGIHHLEHEKQILKRAIDNVKQQCIEGQIENKLLPEKDRLHGSDVMGWKLKENSGDDTCPYYTMKEVNFLDDVRGIQEEKSRQKLVLNGIGNPSNKDRNNHESLPQLVAGPKDAIWVNPKELNIQELKKRFKFKKIS